jgi:hypothetical protein
MVSHRGAGWDSFHAGVGLLEARKLFASVRRHASLHAPKAAPLRDRSGGVHCAALSSVERRRNGEITVAEWLWCRAAYGWRAK